MADQEIDALPADASVGGAEYIPVDDAGTAKYITPTQISAFTVDNIEAISAVGSTTGADSVYILQSGALKPVDIDLVAQHAIDTMWGKTAETAPDDADVFVLKDGGATEKTLTWAVLTAYVATAIRQTVLNAATLDDGGGALADANIMHVTQGSTGKRCTLAEVVAYALGGLDTYLTALGAVSTAADADLLYCTQSGTEKKLPLSVLKTYMGNPVSGPATTVTDNIPQWSNTTGSLKDGGLSKVTSISSPGDHTTLPSALAVHNRLSTIVYDQTDIGGVLADADELIVDDGGAGTAQRKSALSRFWTYVLAKLAANDITIDELAVNGHANVAVGVPDKFALQWVAGRGGLVQLNASIGDTVDHDFEILGTNASNDDVTYYAEGGLTLETDGADGDEVIVLPHLDADVTPWTSVTWGTDQEVRWECRVRTGANITNAIIWAGLKLTNTEVTATDADQVFFRYEDDNNDGEWEAVSSVGGSDDEHDTGVVVAVDTEYHLMIEIQSDRTAKFYINGTLVETSGVLTDAIDLIPYIGVATDGAAAAKSLHVRGQSISRNYA